MTSDAKGSNATALERNRFSVCALSLPSRFLPHACVLLSELDVKPSPHHSSSINLPNSTSRPLRPPQLVSRGTTRVAGQPPQHVAATDFSAVVFDSHSSSHSSDVQIKSNIAWRSLPPPLAHPSQVDAGSRPSAAHSEH
ncbi:hypothetical protein RRG08_030474 [Elysia crispata]|uniref:Uncharacterized protein n=1 Tax=Elysia crispata TaxID=231223 RepID=A0AAE1E7H6_9GAST|nr:hypothetical protein RRG08_030474 [Elysia crispata]